MGMQLLIAVGSAVAGQVAGKLLNKDDKSGEQQKLLMEQAPQTVDPTKQANAAAAMEKRRQASATGRGASINPSGGAPGKGSLGELPEQNREQKMLLGY